jgi:hypothetical protein
MRCLAQMHAIIAHFALKRAQWSQNPCALTRLNREAAQEALASGLGAGDVDPVADPGGSPPVATWVVGSARSDRRRGLLLDLPGQAAVDASCIAFENFRLVFRR